MINDELLYQTFTRPTFMKQEPTVRSISERRLLRCPSLTLPTKNACTEPSSASVRQYGAGVPPPRSSHALRRIKHSL